MPSTSLAVKVVAAILLLLNAKNLPFMFHIRFYRRLVLNFYLRPRSVRDVFMYTDYWQYTTLIEMDFNLHKSNSTYFSDFDLARAELLTTVFRKFYLEFKDPAIELRRGEWVYTALGSVNMVFRRELKGYSMYNVRCRILGWNDKWIFVVGEFIHNGKVHAFGIAKYVFKVRRKTIPPAEVIKFEGLLTEEAIRRNEAVQKYLDDSLELEQLETSF